MTKRRFGVEVECGHNNLTYGKVADALREAKLPGLQDRVDCDGSGIEIKTQPLSGFEGFKALKALYEFLNDNEFYVAECDGLHVHVDAPEFIRNRSNRLRLVQSWHNNQLHVCKFVNEGRAAQAIESIDDDEEWGPSSPCPLWSNKDLSILEGRDTYLGPRGALNIQCLPSTGSVEFRLHEGTLDYNQAEAWIKFCLAFVNHVARLKRPMKVAHDPENLIRRVRAPKASASLVTV